MRFTKDDDRVFAAFLAQRPAEGRKFSTDGRRLDGGMYLSNVASWEMGPRGVEIPVLHDLGSRTAQQIHRRLRKMGGPIVKHEWEIRHTGHRGAERRHGSRVAEGFAGDEPTAKNILEWLGPYMEHEGLDAPRESARLARLIANARTNRQAQEVLEEVNRVIDAHGVEAIRIEGAYIDGYYFDIVATYVNTGDTYSATLLHESATGRFVLTTWGDWFEANEREYLPEEEEEEEEDDDDLDEARRRDPKKVRGAPHNAPSPNPLSGPRKNERDLSIEQAVRLARSTGESHAVTMDKRGDYRVVVEHQAPPGHAIAFAHPDGTVSYVRWSPQERRGRKRR